MLLIVLLIYNTNLHFVLDYLEYFKNTYICREDANGLPSDALFQPARWSCYAALLADRARSNSAIEGWHQAFNRRFPRKGMPLSSFMARLRDEEDKTTNLMTR